VQELRIEIDQSKQKKRVFEITESNYFRDLQSKVKNMREKRNSS